MMKGARACRVAVGRVRAGRRLRRCATPGRGARLRLSLLQPLPRNSLIRQADLSDARSGGRYQHA